MHTRMSDEGQGTMGQSRFVVLGLCLASCSNPGIRAHEDENGGAGGNDGTGGAPHVVFRVIDGGRGRDVPGEEDGGPSSVRGGGECGARKYDIEKLPPEMLLLFDRSGSMTMALGTSTRWKAATEALNASIKDTEDTVLWGLKLFPSDSGCDVTADVEVAVAINNFNGKMSPAIAATSPNLGAGGTPTQFVVTAGADYLKSLTTPNPKYLLLATDGEPSCGADPSGESITAIKDALAAGFSTFVVGIATAADKVANDTLNQMAIEGGQPLDGATKYYTVANKADLVAKLAQITKKVACIFPLGMVPPSPDDVVVHVGDMRVPRDKTHKEGWDYTAGMNSAQLYGKWCEMLQNGAGGAAQTAMKVDIVFGCPNVPIQ